MTETRQSEFQPGLLGSANDLGEVTERRARGANRLLSTMLLGHGLSGSISPSKLRESCSFDVEERPYVSGLGEAKQDRRLT